MTYRPAFSILEMLVTISLFLLLCGISLQFIPRATQRTVRAATHKLAALFAQLRTTSMTQHQKLHLKFNPSSNSYTYHLHGKKIRTTLDAGIHFSAPTHLKGPPARPKKYIDRPITYPVINGYATVTFYPDGHMSAGTVYLADTEKKCIKALTTDLAHVSYIRLYHAQDSAWEPF